MKLEGKKSWCVLTIHFINECILVFCPVLCSATELRILINYADFEASFHMFHTMQIDNMI